MSRKELTVTDGLAVVEKILANNRDYQCAHIVKQALDRFDDMSDEIRRLSDRCAVLKGQLQEKSNGDTYEDPFLEKK